MQILKAILLRFLNFFLPVIFFIICIQDVLIFPALLSSLKLNKNSPLPLPQNVESIFIKTADKEEIELWRLPAKESSSIKDANKFIAIIAHGNGGPLADFLIIQEWFSARGITSYDFDYRGYGRSSGWPSESGIYLDADAVWEYVTKREQVIPENVIVVGYSIGSATGAYLAKKHNVKILILLAPYSNLKALVRDRPIYKYLSNALWYNFPTDNYVSELKETSVILSHGRNDLIIPYYHSEILAKNYQGKGTVHLIIKENAAHNQVLTATSAEIEAALISITKN